MTTYFPQQVNCAVCGRQSTEMLLGSTNTFGGAPDLDTRPPDMARATLHDTIYRCHRCGYCHTSLDALIEGAKTVVASDEYQGLLLAGSVPRVARYYLAQCLLLECAGDYDGAVWAAVQAAWVCDDKNIAEQARHCRNKALALIARAEANGGWLAQQAGAAVAIKIDLYRRAGRFEEARELLLEIPSVEIDQRVLQVIGFQAGLIRDKDTRAYTTADANLNGVRDGLCC